MAAVRAPKHDVQSLKPHQWAVQNMLAASHSRTVARRPCGCGMPVSACLCSPLQEGLHLLGSPTWQQIGNALAQLAHACVSFPLLLQSQAEQPLIFLPVHNPAESKLLEWCRSLALLGHQGQSLTLVIAVQFVLSLYAKSC